MKALGIDVSLSRRLDAVLLDEVGHVLTGPQKLGVDELAALIKEAEPDVVAIDSPPEWGTDGKSRPIERQLARLGIHIYATPQDPGDHKFYRWMRVGFEAFGAAAALGYALYRGGTRASQQAIEVFPHASAVTLRGSLPASGTPKLQWRRAVLLANGVDVTRLRTVDHLDAALAALTGIHFLKDEFSVVGVPGEAVLVLPVPVAPVHRLGRDLSP